jgi:hypothetical protein
LIRHTDGICIGTVSAGCMFRARFRLAFVESPKRVIGRDLPASDGLTFHSITDELWLGESYFRTLGESIADGPCECGYELLCSRTRKVLLTGTSLKKIALCSSIQKHFR